jgi:predicted permease
VPEPGRERRVERVLRLLLRLYPPDFRAAVGRDLVETSVARLRDATQSGRRTRVLRFWLTEGVRFAVDGVLERFRTLPAAIDDGAQALRRLRREPRFYGLAIVTLALGIAAVTTIFTVTDAVLFRPLRFDRAGELYLLQSRFGPMRFSSNSLPNLQDLRSSVTMLDWVAGAHDYSPALADGVSEPERLASLLVTEDYLPGLGARVHVGRPFAPADYGAGADRVAIVSYGLWQRRWGGRLDALGRSVRLDGVAHTLVGVMDRGFRDPAPIESGTPTGMWVPARHGDPALADRGHYAFQLLGRLAPGASLDAARDELAAAGARLSEAYPGDNRFGENALAFELTALADATVGDVRGRLLLLLGAVILLLTLACANVANLFLANGTTRQQELAVRSALGASSGRLVRQLLLESSATAALAGILGAVLGAAGIRAFLAAAPEETPRLHEVALDARVFLVVMGVTGVTALAFGALPALRASRAALRDASAARVTASRPALRAQSVLVATEVALSLVLVAGSALLLGSFVRLLRVEPGFDASDVVIADVRPPASAEDPDRQRVFYETLRERAAALPGVAHAALAYSPPGVRGGAYTRVAVEGRPAADFADEFFRINPVAGGFFEAVDIPVRAGRVFAPDVRGDEPPVIVLNEAAARRFFPAVDLPVGRRVTLSPEPGAPMREVIGVVGDVRQRGPAEDAEPQIYVPYVQEHLPRLSLLVEQRPDVVFSVGAFRQLVREIAPDVPVDRVEPLQDRYRAGAAQTRFLASLLVVFAALGLLLAAVGTYATANYAVSRRIREVGVRRALGAPATKVFRLVLARALGVTGIGMAAGVALTLALSRFLEGYVFGITARDPATVALACTVIAASATLASVGPALRAARVDPNRVLRAE